jgi:hypothetical protein
MSRSYRVITNNVSWAIWSISGVYRMNPEIVFKVHSHNRKFWEVIVDELE